MQVELDEDSSSLNNSTSFEKQSNCTSPDFRADLAF